MAKKPVIKRLSPAITSYTVTVSPGNITATGTSSPITVTGLTNGTIYTFTVTAANATGNSAASAVSNSVTPTAYPDATADSIVETQISGKYLIVTLDSTLYDKVAVVVKNTEYSEQAVTGQTVSLNLPTETGSYQIYVRLYDKNGNSYTSTDVLLYSNRVKYTPGKGDGFGWEMWKN